MHPCGLRAYTHDASPLFEVHSANLGQTVQFNPQTPQRRGDWVDYLQGMCAHLYEFCQAPNTPTGARIYVSSSVPPGSGLSSSAALEVAFGRALRTLWQLPLGDVDIARLGQTCERQFVGANVGIMDQMVASVGRPHHALLLDTQSLACEHIPLPTAMDIRVIHSGVRHSHAGGEYNDRRSECEAAAQALNVDTLCQLGIEALPQLQALPITQQRRARHAISENARVTAAVKALRNSDVQGLGALLNASHVSLRDDYQVSVPAVDSLVNRAVRQPGVLGARITGGGFGGCLIVLTEAGRGDATAAATVEACRHHAPQAHVVV